MRSRIKSIEPQMRNGTQNSYEGSHGTMYTFLAVLEDGTTGQVSAKSMAPHRFIPGDEVEYTYTPADKPQHLGRLKVEKPKDSAPQQSAEAPRTSGWTPAKEASVMIQGFLKSIVESGAARDQWSGLLGHAIAIHDNTLRARIAAKQHPAHAPQPAPVHDDDLPF